MRYGLVKNPAEQIFQYREWRNMQHAERTGDGNQEVKYRNGGKENGAEQSGSGTGFEPVIKSPP